MKIEYNIRGILHAFFRQKVKILLVFSLFCLAGLYTVMQLGSYYQARVSFLVKFGQGARPDVNLPDTRPTEFSHSDRNEMMESNIKILESHSLLRDAIMEVGVNRLYPPVTEGADNIIPDEADAVETAINRLLGGDLTAKTSGDSNIIELLVKNQNAEMAALFANTLMEKFMVRQAEVYNTAQTSFLDNQTGEMKNKVEVSRNDFLKFKEEVGISTIDEEMSRLLNEKSSLSTAAFGSVTEAQEALAALETKAAEMRATYRENSPVMKGMQQSIAVARKELRDRQSDLNNIEDKNGSLSEKIASIDERIAWLEAQRGRYNELEQRVLMDEENYRYYQQRGEEARVNNLLNAENITRISVVDPATVPAKPISPRKKLILLAFLMAGLLFGLTIGVVLELLDESLASPEQLVNAIDLPVLATFAKVKGV